MEPPGPGMDAKWNRKLPFLLTLVLIQTLKLLYSVQRMKRLKTKNNIFYKRVLAFKVLSR
jgi:hypothetical protein